MKKIYKTPRADVALSTGLTCLQWAFGLYMLSIAFGFGRISFLGVSGESIPQWEFFLIKSFQILMVLLGLYGIFKVIQSYCIRYIDNSNKSIGGNDQ